MANVCLEIQIFFKFNENSTFFGEFAYKNQIFLSNCLKNQFFSEICLEKSKSLVKLPEKIEIFRKFACKNRNCFDPDPRPSQISNQIDAAVANLATMNTLTEYL